MTVSDQRGSPTPRCWTVMAWTPPAWRRRIRARVGSGRRSWAREAALASRPGRSPLAVVTAVRAPCLSESSGGSTTRVTNRPALPRALMTGRRPTSPRWWRPSSSELGRARRCEPRARTTTYDGRERAPRAGRAPSRCQAARPGGRQGCRAVRTPARRRTGPPRHPRAHRALPRCGRAGPSDPRTQEHLLVRAGASSTVRRTSPRRTTSPAEEIRLRDRPAGTPRARR